MFGVKEAEMSSVKKVLMLLVLGIVLFHPSRSWAQDEASSIDTVGQWTWWLGAGAAFYEADEENEAGQLYDLRINHRVSPDLSYEIGIGGSPFLEGNNFDAPDPREGDFSGRNSTGENWFVKNTFSVMYHVNGATTPVDPYLSLIGGMQYYDKRREDGQWAPMGGPGFGVAYWVDENLAFRGDYNAVLVKDADPEINHHVLAMVHYNFGGDGRGGDQEGKGDELGAGSTGPLKTIYFDFDKSNLSGQAQSTLKENATWLQGNPSTRVSLEGHCDERGTNEYNMALGQRRAKSAQDYLRSLGVGADRLSITSYGEEVPAEPGHNEAAWAKNRRVESVIKK